MDALIGDSQKASAKILAGQDRAFKKKEGRYQLGKSLLKSLVQFVPGGKLISSGIDTIGDSILRNLGFGGDPDKFKLSGKNLAFGGEEAVGTMKEGAQDYLDMARERSITNALASLVSYGLDKGWDDKIGDMLGFGGKNTALQKEALKLQNTRGAGMGTQTIMDSLEEGAGGEWAASAGLGFADPSLNFGRTQIEGLSRFIDPKNTNLLIPTTIDSVRDSMIDKAVDAGTDPTTLWLEQLMNPGAYEQSGMVQKYQGGGQVAQTTSRKLVDGQWVNTWDTYEYDGFNWNKTQSQLEENPGLTNMTHSEMANYRDPTRTKDVSSQYMDDPSEHGIQEFLRTPAVAALVEKARAGSDGALENLVELIRQSRPEIAQSNEALRASIKKILPKMDLYGEGYQDVLAGAETTLEGLVGKAQTARGQRATQQATSGIRRPGTTGAISEALYTGAEDVYAGMQRDIQGEYDESFGDFEKMIANV